MASEVRIKVTADTGEAQKDLKQLDKKVTTTKDTVGGLSSGFGELTKSLGALGIGTLGFSALLGGTIKIIQKAAEEGAQLDFVFGLLPDSLKQAFNDMKPNFAELGALFGRTENDVAIAYAILLRDTRRANITMEELAGTLGFVAREGLGVEEAAVLVANALNGDIGAIKRVTGFYSSLTEALRLSALTGRDAVTIYDQIATEFRQTTLDMGRALDQLAKGNFLEVLIAMEDVRNSGFTFLIPGMASVNLLIDGIIAAGGDVGDFKDALIGAGGKVKSFFDDILGGSNSTGEAIVGFGLKMGEVGELTEENQAFRDYLAGLTGDLGTALTAAELLRAELASPFPTGFPTGFPPPPRLPAGAGTFSSFADQAIESGFDRPPTQPFPGPQFDPTPIQPRPGVPRPIPIPGPTSGVFQPGSGGDDDPFFDDGGIVGGAPGTHQRIIAKAGERVLTEPQQAGMMGGGNVTIIIEGDAVVDSETRMDALARKVQENLTTLARGGQSI